MEYPLVSLIVITYNSSNFILEALDSIKSQTYKKIELIISDDCSVDDTVKVCQEWMELNSSSFVRSKILINQINTGISANCNRGILASSGTWLMVIGADDALLPDCVKDNIDFINNNVGARVIFSQSLRYLNTFRQGNSIGMRDFAMLAITHPDVSSEDQHQILLRGSKVNAATTFFQRSLLDEFGLFDEEIPMVDDWPFWLKITAAGIRISFFNKITANYRIRNDSVCNENQGSGLYGNHHLRTRKIYTKYILPNVSFIERFFINYEYYRIIFCQKIGIDTRFLIMRMLFIVISAPSVVYLRWKERKTEKRVLKRLQNSKKL
jgi:glycosyltransferase involved in cell wall biosynthesis